MADGYFNGTYFVENYFPSVFPYFPVGADGPPKVVFESSSRIGKYPLQRRRRKLPDLFDDTEFVTLLINYLEMD